MRTKLILIKLILISFLLVSCGGGGGSSPTIVSSDELQKLLGTFTETQSKVTNVITNIDGVETKNTTETEEDVVTNIVTNDSSKECDEGDFSYIGEGNYPLTYDCKFEEFDATVTITVDDVARRVTLLIDIKEQDVELEGVPAGGRAKGSYEIV